MNLTVKQGEMTLANHLICCSSLEAVATLDTVTYTLQNFDDLEVVLEGISGEQVASARMVIAKIKNLTAKTHEVTLTESGEKMRTFTWSVRRKS